MKTYHDIETALKKRLADRPAKMSPKTFWPLFVDTFLQLDREFEHPIFDIGIALELFGAKGSEPETLTFTLYTALEDSEGEYLTMESVFTNFAVKGLSELAGQPNWFFEDWKLRGPQSAEAILQSAERDGVFQMLLSLPECEIEVGGEEV